MTAVRPRVVLQVPAGEAVGWWSLENPVEILEAKVVDEVRPVLRQAESAADAGRIAAGFISYEAAPAFDAAFKVAQPGAIPLAWFAVFETPECIDPFLPGMASYQLAPLRPSIAEHDYQAAIRAIHSHIAGGDTYQVNFTFRLASELQGDPWSLFADLCRGQESRCSAFVDTGRHVLCSASPELFFHLHGDRIWSRPMKGTVARGRTLDEDRKQARWLQTSAKNRAENVMIVDMVRNDMGRIAAPETVRVADLWQLEKYPSLFQMVSSVEAQTDAGIEEIFTALFPCASVTGAPKVSSMEIIEALETGPRGAYTGAIGWIGPGRRARFNVAIRTVEIDRADGGAIYGTGSGVVWDSVADEEWRECRTKAQILQAPPPEFELLETLLWDPPAGILLLDRHLHRLQESAQYFDFSCDAGLVRDELSAALADLPPKPHRIRLLMNRRGEVRTESQLLVPNRDPWRLAIAHTPITSTDRFLFHKTTHRELFDQHRRKFPEHDDVLLWNEKGEVTESTLANIVLRKEGRLITPPQGCGLLAGTFRAELLAAGEIEERTIHLPDLQQAEEILLINSVRRWIRTELDTATVNPIAETRPGQSA